VFDQQRPKAHHVTLTTWLMQENPKASSEKLAFKHDSGRYAFIWPVVGRAS
jgi:hypothetical protein